MHHWFSTHHLHCMRRWSRTNSGRLIRRSPSPPLNMAHIGVEKFSEHENDQALQNLHEQPRTLRDFMHPTRIGSPSCIVFPSDASRFNFKPDIIQLLYTFYGFEFENPYLHLREFEEVSNTCTDQNCSININIIMLKFFPFSLKDKAKIWLQNLTSGSIRT